MRSASGERSWVRLLADPGAGITEVGGKGASLAGLAAAGLPVPDGFHLTTAAYDAFVAAHRLRPRIAAFADQAFLRGDDHAAVERSAAAIGALFTGNEIPAGIRSAIDAAYQRLGGGAVAVRSSATAEDLPELSFAGQQDTFVNVRGLDAVLDAIRRCWASLWTARAMRYRHRAGIVEVSLAVVVQKLVAADAAGVLFTADPVTGAAGRVWINASYGLGEAVVGGRVTPDTYIVDAGTGRLTHEQVHDKAVMTVRTPAGTTERTVPLARRTASTLTRSQAERLAALGLRVAEGEGRPMDVEWALSRGRFWLLQARPITTSAPAAAQPDPWNDARDVAYAWTNTNVGEAIPDVMTPATWWLVQAFLAEALPGGTDHELWLLGRIGGRLYVNLSRLQTFARAAGLSDARFRHMIQQVFGRLPDELPIPADPDDRWRTLRRLAPVAVRLYLHAKRDMHGFEDYLLAHPARCADLRHQLAGITDPHALVIYWRRVLEPAYRRSARMLSASMRSSGVSFVAIRTRLRSLVGAQDANALTAGHGRELASLDLLRGLDRLASGAIDEATFNQTYGHRGPHEFEVSLPRPGEDPRRLARQLAQHRAGPSTGELLRRQRTAYEMAWTRLRRSHPLVAPRVARQLRTWVTISHQREAARSAVARTFWVMRDYLLRAGELTGLGDDVFLLGLDEVAAVLAGQHPPGAAVAARRAAYERYRALPPAPSLISGRFDVFAWAADPHRRSDVYVAGPARRPATEDGDVTGGDTGGADPVLSGSVLSGSVLSGFGGSAGVVEGTARVLADMDEGPELHTGEILVTSVTNVGWTPLFPRAAAVVTDIGAPLSHAAIVARELGIPAVVGCGDATSRIATGDRLRVDGGAGTVELLAPTSDVTVST